MQMMQTIKTKTISERKNEIEIIYNLIFQNALYSLECIRVDGNENKPNNYCFIENVTEDETEAENFLRILAKGRVFPVHIKDIIEDYFK